MFRAILETIFWTACVLFFIFLFLFVCLRFFRSRRIRRVGRARRTKASVCAVLGSGGHTTEILRLMTALPKNRYRHRVYILADTDTTSLKQLENDERDDTDYVVHRIPRSREVRQSYLSSVYSTLVAVLSCVPIVSSLNVDVLLCNGPGTCVPVCFIAYIFDLVFFRTHRIIFVESICRVETLSTTGKILYYSGLADAFFVQWPQLQESYPSTIYLGRIL